MIRIIKLSEIADTPWKNGLGKTKQIVIWPENTSLATNDFIWRLSSATISENSSFSTFPECDRALVVWKGAGVYLNKNLLQKDSPIYFHGEEKIECELAGGEVVDIGLIYKRDRVNVKTEVLNIEKELKIEKTSNREFLFLASGESCSILNFNIEVGDTVEVKSEDGVDIKVASPSIFYRFVIEEKP